MAIVGYDGEELTRCVLNGPPEFILERPVGWRAAGRITQLYILYHISDLMSRKKLGI